jgi:hypothetical protein
MNTELSVFLIKQCRLNGCITFRYFKLLLLKQSLAMFLPLGKEGQNLPTFALFRVKSRPNILCLILHKKCDWNPDRKCWNRKRYWPLRQNAANRCESVYV